jgi:hypothetical protein
LSNQAIAMMVVPDLSALMTERICGAGSGIGWCRQTRNRNIRPIVFVLRTVNDRPQGAFNEHAIPFIELVGFTS